MRCLDRVFVNFLRLPGLPAPRPHLTMAHMLRHAGFTAATGLLSAVQPDFRSPLMNSKPVILRPPAHFTV
jgi:hypothetical protein